MLKHIEYEITLESSFLNFYKYMKDFFPQALSLLSVFKVNDL